MSLTLTAGELAGRLARDVRGVCRELLPSGVERGGEWCVGSVAGEEGNSLRVRLSGTKAGVWKDFAGSDKGGDLLDLWAAVRGVDLGAAYREACRYLGIERPRFQDRVEHAVRLRAPEGARKADEGSKVWGWLTDTRSIPAGTLKAYRVGVKDGAALFPAFDPDGHLQYVKFRAIEEKRFWSAPGAKPCLFGWQAIPGDARSVVIAEGEMDAMSWHASGFPALSPTNGAGNAQWVETEFDRLARFDRVYLSYDGDDAGRAGAMEVVERLGRERCFLVELPEKDANACLMVGETPDIFAGAIEEARGFDPEELVSAADFVEDIVALMHPDGVEPGVRLPWEKAGSRFIARPGELTILAGVNSHGKSQMVGHLTLDAMRQGERACIASMEYKPAKWLQRLTRQVSGLPQPSAGFIRGICKQWFRDRLWAFTCAGTAKRERIVDVFAYAARRYGVKWFVVDNLAKCGLAEDDYNGQKQFVEVLGDFARDRDVHVVICAHMRKSDDEGRQLGKMDIKGTGAITDMADNVLVLWRNKKKEAEREDARMAWGMGAGAVFDESEQPDAVLKVHKARNGDEEPSFRLWFCAKSTQFIEQYGKGPRQYVRWSETEQPAPEYAGADG